jgi:hypothetical protein
MTTEEMPIRIPPALFAAYTATLYEINAPTGTALIRIGQPVPEELHALAFHWDRLAFITAFNPFSVTLSSDENLRRHQVLQGTVDVTGHRMLDGAGRDTSGEWPPETSLAIFDATDDELDDWMLAFGQNAIVVGTRGGNVELRLHPYEASRVAQDLHASQRSAARLWARATMSRNLTLLVMALHPDVEYLAPDGNDDTVGRTAVVDRLSLDVFADTEVAQAMFASFRLRAGQIGQIDLRDHSRHGPHSEQAPA